jgi:transposase
MRFGDALKVILSDPTIAVRVQSVSLMRSLTASITFTDDEEFEGFEIGRRHGPPQVIDWNSIHISEFGAPNKIFETAMRTSVTLEGPFLRKVAEELKEE